MSTVFVTLCDKSYHAKALQTLEELRTNGKWIGDTILLAVDFLPDPIPGVKTVGLRHIDTDRLLGQWKTHPIRPMSDNRHLGKLYQWDKLQVFTPYFQQWERVVFLDAGMRIFDSVQPLLDIDFRGKLIAPDDSDPYDNGARFRIQLDLDANPQAKADLFSVYPETILDEHYFLNCIFLFDTALIDRVSLKDLEGVMNAYPICMCNEMGIMNLLFSFKLRVWQPLPQRAGDKYIFGWSERNYNDGPTWRDFHCLKYSFSG